MKKHVLLSTSFFGLTLLQGCVPLRSNSDTITVESDPPGAEVHVMGKKTGVTPLEIRQVEVFPLTYSPEQQSLYGTIMLRHAGCRDYTQRVTTTAYGKGINAKLDCGQKPAEAARSDRNQADTPIEKRLQKLKELLEKGLITEEEAKATRRRILEGL
jgi:hypothetical protein